MPTVYHYTKISNLPTILESGRLGADDEYLCVCGHPSYYSGETYGTVQISLEIYEGDCINSDDIYNLQHAAEINEQLDDGELLREDEVEIVIWGGIPRDRLKIALF